MRLVNSRIMNSKQSLIFRAAQDGIYGKTFSFSQGSITDAFFVFPPTQVLPEEYRLELMDEAAFNQQPFGHGENYSSFSQFDAEGAGAVVWKDGKIAASASSFLSMNGEIELDVSTKEEHRGLGLATSCISKMLEECMNKGLAVHWDAQNETSKHLAQKFGFEVGEEYRVYYKSE